MLKYILLFQVLVNVALACNGTGNPRFCSGDRALWLNGDKLEKIQIVDQAGVVSSRNGETPRRLYVATIVNDSDNKTFNVFGDEIAAVEGCVESKWNKICIEADVYLLEKGENFDEFGQPVWVDKYEVAGILTDKFLLKRIGGKIKVRTAEEIIVREGCAMRNKFCVGEEVFVAGKFVGPRGKIVGVTLDGSKILAQRMMRKYLMDPLETIRLLKPKKVKKPEEDNPFNN